MPLRLYGRHLLGFISLWFVAFHACAVGPDNRVHPNRPNPPGPNNPIGPNNPAVSNPLSTLNPSTPFSNNQIVLRQLLLPTQKSALPSAATPSAGNTLYTYIPNASLHGGSPHNLAEQANYRLLLNNRSVFSTSHPLVFERPNPMTPFSNGYTVIDGRYYAISHDPANSPSLYVSKVDSPGATLFNGSNQIYIGLGQDIKLMVQER